MLSLKYLISVICALVAVFAASIQAAPTQPISYQGRLTNGVGIPVANGTYTVTFAIYADPSGGSALWTEELAVTTSDGLFTALLGSANPFDNTLFSEFPRYLGITIDAGPEMSPRILMASVPYALNSPSGAGGYWQQSGSSIYYNGGKVGIGTATPGDMLEVNGGVTINWWNGPRLTLKDGAAGAERPRITFGGDYLAIFDGDATTGHIFSFMNTFSNVRDYDASLRVHGRTTGSWGTFLDLTHDGTKGIISTDFGGISLMPANGSVVLPDNAVSAGEILDEPGIAANANLSVVSLLQGLWKDIITDTITIPSPGYIYLSGNCYVTLAGTTGEHSALIQIVESAGDYGFGATMALGAQSFSGTGGHWYPVHVQRVFYKTAGTYTFRLGGRHDSSPPSTIAYVDGPSLTAMFLPTSYGIVKTLVSATESRQFNEAEAIQARDLSGTRTGETLYRVDLRELELKVAKARAEADRLERQVVEAKLNERQKQQNQIESDKK